MKGRSHAPMVLHPDRLFSLVGTCGTNAPVEYVAFHAGNTG